MMRLLFILMLFSYGIGAQSLIMNGSFEEENICTEYIKNCAPEGWMAASMRSGYYFDDARNAFSGTHYAGLSVATVRKPSPANFIRTRLLCGLRRGATYRLSLAVRSHHKMDSIGIYFSADDVLYRKEGLKRAQPQLIIPSTVFTGAERGTWQKITLNYTATGNEGYMAIGYFQTRAFRSSQPPDVEDAFYFFFDAVSLLPANHLERLCASSDSVRKVEYADNPRHSLLEKRMYVYQRRTQPIHVLPVTALQRIDTLVIPDVLFESNQYTMSTHARLMVDQFIANVSRRTLDSFVVEGHTDNIGRLENNQKLSLNRARFVADYIQKRLNVYTITRGWADSKPVADNRTAEGRQLNRRVEIYLYIRED